MRYYTNLSMITDMNEFIKVNEAYRGKGTFSVECLCEQCNEPFVVTKREGVYRSILNKNKLICSKCAHKNSGRNFLSGKEKLNKIRAEKSKEFQNTIKELEDSQLNNRIYTVEELEEYVKNKGRACTCICNDCGRELPFFDRYHLRRYAFKVRNRDKIRCRSCEITNTKIENNKVRKIGNLIDCEFLEGQEYIGCDFGKIREERLKYKFKCNLCGEVFEDSFNMGDEVPVSCPKCSPLRGQVSIGEKDVLNYIKSIYGGKVIENCRSLIPPYELDIYLPEKNLAIEFDGSYWHNNSKKSFEKYNLCKEKGVRLIMLYDYEWGQKNNLIKEVLKSQIVGNENKIGARECEIRLVEVNEAKDFINYNHIQGSPQNITNKDTISIGLYYKNSLVQIETFNKPRFNSKYDWELIRECTKIGYTVLGGKSKILKFFRRNYKGSIISYCDKRFFSGISYEKLGFEKLKDSQPSYVYFKRGLVLSREKCMKHKLPKLLENFDENKTETENMLDNKYLKLWDFGNFVFVLK